MFQKKNMFIKTSEQTSIKPFLKQFYLPPENSHKGQNGKVLIIGGSALFHAASIWAAETAAHFVDMVHYTSTEENNEIFLSLKKKFINGIVVKQKDLLDYMKEDDTILIGPGMVRAEDGISQIKYQILDIDEIEEIKNEGLITYYLTKFLLNKFPEKRWVIDAGALQMLDKQWFSILKTKPILTPHQVEFENLFKVKIKDKSMNKKMQVVKEVAARYKCVILLKAVSDIVSDGEQMFIIEGGNAGLTKGGTGDVLAGLVASFYTKNDAITSSILASYLLKKTAEELSKNRGYWYNISDIIDKLPEVLNNMMQIYK